jgi:hypothetical protein
MAYVTLSYLRAREWTVEMETKAAAKFAPLLVSRAAEGLDVMRMEGI